MPPATPPVLQWLQPRDHQAAARSLFALCAVAALTTVVFTPFAPGNDQMTVAAGAVAMLVAAIIGAVSWLARYLRPTHTLAWAAIPVAAVVAIVALDFLTSDASLSAQVFLFFPALYASSQLRVRGGILVTAAAVAGEVAVVASLAPVREAVTDIGYVVAVIVTTAALLIRSAERQAQLVAELRHQAAIDPLTGLVTRRVFDEAAQSAMSGALRGQGTALLLVDVDHFKQINDQHGHPAGDQVLIQLANLLSDASGADDVVSRLGGDEIALLLPGCSMTGARARAEQLMWDVRAHPFAVGDGDPITVSISIGCAHAPTHADSLHRLYGFADAALYDAKRDGRNRVSGPVDPDRVSSS